MTKKKPVPPYLVATNQQIDLSYFDRLPDVASPEPVQKRKTGIMARMGDAALALGQGAVGSFKAISDVAGADNAVSRGLGSVSEFLGEQKSEESRATLQASQQRIRDAEQTGDWKEEAKAYLGMIWDQPAEMLAQGVGSFATLGLGKAAQALKLTQAAKAAGMTKEAFLATRAGQEAAQAAAEVGFKANIGVSAAQGLGGVKGSQYEQTYQNAIAQGHTPEQAQAMATEAQSYGGAGAVQQLVGAGLGGLAAATGPIERAIAGRVRMSDAPQSVLGSIGKGFATEGATEGAQGAQERLAGNEAAIRAGVLDPSQRFAGVVGQGLQEGVIGGVIGGVAGPLDRAPAGPLARAAMAGAPVAPVAPAPVGPIDFENVPIPKPEGMQTAEPATGGMDFEADPRFKQAPIYPNGAAPERQQYGTPEAASIALGEQGLVGSHEVRQPQPGVFEIRHKAAPRVRMVQPGIYELPPSPKSPVSPAAQAASPASPMSPELAQQEPTEGPAPVIPVQMPSEELRRAGVDPLTGELPPPPPFAPVPPALDATEPGMVKGPDGTLRATFDTEQEARDHIAAGRKQDRSIAISHQPVQLPDGRWTLALPGEPGHRGKKIKVRLDGAGIPGQDATLLDPNTAKPWRSKQAAGKFAKTVDGYEVLQNPDGGWILQQKVKGAAPEAQPGMSVSQEAPKDAAPTPIEFSAEDRSRIEGMFAEGKNGAQVAKALGRAEPHADVVRAVGALRKELGIPGVSDAEAFKAWREGRKTVQKEANDKTQDDANSRVGRLDEDEGQMPKPIQEGPSVLPREGDFSSPGMGGGLQRVSGGSGDEAIPQALSGQDRREQGVRAGQRAVGDSAGAVSKPSLVPQGDGVRADKNSGGVGSTTEPTGSDSVSPDQGRDGARKGADVETERGAEGQQELDPQRGNDDAAKLGSLNRRITEGDARTDQTGDANRESADVAAASEVDKPLTAAQSPAEAPTEAQAKWDAATQDQRFETLKAAGWGFGKAGPSASAKQTAGKAWDKLTDSQRERIGAVAQPTQILTSEDTLKQLAQALEAAGMKPMADADGAMGRVFELDVGNVSVVRAEVVSSMGQPQQVKVSALVPSMPTQTETVMTPEAAVSLVRDYAKKVEQYRQDAAKKMASGLIEAKPKELTNEQPTDNVAAIAGAPADAGTGATPDAGAGEPSVGSGADDTRGAVDSGAVEPVASAADAGSGGDGAKAVEAPDPGKVWDEMPPSDRAQMLDRWFGAGVTDAGDRYKGKSWRQFNVGERDSITAMLAASRPVTESATHKDPGEKPEPATAAVVRKSLDKAAGNTDRKPADMKAELLAMVDEKLKDAQEFYLPERKEPTADQLRNAMVSAGLPNLAAAEKYLADYHLSKIREEVERIGYVTFKVPGDGTFKVFNSKDKLQEFRRKVETSPGFKNSTQKPKPTGMAGGEAGYGGALGAVKGMIDEGDPQAAVDYAAARSMNLAEVLKGDKVRLGKIAGLEPTGEPVVEPPADTSWMAMYEPEEQAAQAPAAPVEEKPSPKALTTTEMVQKGRDDYAAGADRQKTLAAVPAWQAQDWIRGWDEAKADADAKTAGKVVLPSEYPTQEADSSYSGISHSGSSRARSDRDAFVDTVQRLYDEALPLVETPAQREALDKAIQTFKAEYLKQAQRVIKTRAGTVSSYVAGRAKFNTKQADKRGSALDRALADFDGWLKEAAPDVKTAVLAARTPEQIAKEQQAKEAKQAEKDAKRRASDLALMEKVLSFKAGDELKIGPMLVTSVSKDKDGYPLTLTIKAQDGEPLTNDKLNLATEIFGKRGVAGMREGKAKIRELVDAIKAKQEPKAEPAQAQSEQTASAEEPKRAQKPAESEPASKTPIVDGHMALMKAVRDGTATAEEYKASFERLSSNQEAVAAELNTRTKEELLKAGGAMFYMRNKGENKPYIVKRLVDDMLDDYSLGKSYQQGGFVVMTAAGVAKRKEETAASLKALVMGQTDEDIKAFAKEIEEARAENQAARAAKQAALENPQTLSDFRNAISEHLKAGKTRTEAFLMLTPEQRIRYDELEAENSREAREARKRAAKTEVRSAGQTTGGEIIATKHTRDGHDLWVVKLADRVSKEDYMTLLASAKRMGGTYSSFRGNGAIPGFQFRNPESAQAFLKLAGGDTTDAKEVVEQRRDAYEDDRSQSAVERLREMADKMEGAAEEQLSRERKTNTARRARFAVAAMNEADAAKAMARTMRNIAQAIDDGKAKFLDAVRTKTQVELLTRAVQTAKDSELRAKYKTYGEQEKRKGEPPTAETADFAEFPYYSAFRSDLASLARQMLEVEGTKKMGQQLMAVADDVTEAYTEFAKKPENLHQLSRFSYKAGDEVKTAIFPSREMAEKAIRRSGLVGKAIVLVEKRGVNRIIMSPSEAINAKIWTGDGDKRITLTSTSGAALVEAIGRRGNRSNGLTVPWQFQTTYDRKKALSRLGIETASEYRSALREFISLQERATANKVREMELALVGKANDGLDFFPTSQEIADQMVEAADIQPDMAVLEPSAGMGHIADRIRQAGAEPDVVEMAEDRRELLQEKGYNLSGRDFLDIKPREFYTFGDVFRAPDGTEGVMRGSGGMGSNRVMLKPLNEDGTVAEFGGTWYDRDELTGIGHRGSDSGYDRIIMNPPFSKRRDAEHVMHAYTLLKPGGRIVAIMGEGVFFGQDKKAEDFRNWLEEVGGTSEKLPDGSFMDPSLPVNTAVNARMVVIDKPQAAEKDETPVFSRGGPAKNVLSALQQNDDLFQLPATDAKTVEQIAADIDPALKVTALKPEPGQKERYRIETEDGRSAYLMIRAPNPYGPSIYGFDLVDGEMVNKVEGLPGENTEAIPEGVEELFIDASKLKEGSGGAKVYAIASALALNTDRLFIGDPAGLSDEALRRRTENMLSSALRYGTTAHLAPHPRQVAGDAKLGVPPLKWVYGDHIGNIERLIDVNLKALDNAGDGEDRTQFNPDNGLYQTGGGREVPGVSLAQAVADHPDGRAGTGGRTLARAAVWRALLRQSGSEGAGAGRGASLLAELARLANDRPSSVEGLFSRGAGAGMQPDAVREAVAKLTKNWSNAPEVVVVSSMTDAAIPAAVRDENQRQLSQGATGEPEGFFYGGKAYLVASQIGSEQDARRVLFHETLGHYGLRGMFGEDLKGILGQIIAARPREVRAKVMEYGLNWNSKADRLIAAEEVLAVMAQENPELGFVRRAVAAIRTWLRGVGMRLGLSDAEIIRDFILPARQFVTGRRAGAGGGVMFSRGNAIGEQLAPQTGEAMFSRSTQRAAETLKAFDVKQAAKATGNTLAHYRGMAMQALGRRQIVELWGKDLPQLVSYSEHVQRMEAEKNDTAAEADAIADAWGKLNDETKLAELMHDATVAQIDPAKPYQLVDSRADYDRLRKAWDALSPEAQGIYIKARDSYAAHYQAVKDSITERVMRTMAAGAGRNALLERMERDFFKSTKGVYFPLARFGKYVVLVKDKDGNTAAVSRGETINEASEAQKRLMEAYPASKGFEVSKILKDKEYTSKDGPGKAFMGDLIELLEGSNASEELIDSVGQLYLSSLPDLSWTKHGIHRKGTPGFSQDARRAFAQNVFHGARYLARLRWADRLQNDLTDMQEHVQANARNEDFDSIKSQQVVDEMVERHKLLMNPNSNPLSTALTSIGFVFHLGLSPASAMVNLLQTATTAYPVMGAKWGFDKSAAALMTASREAVKGGNDISQGLSGDELAAYNEAVKTGVIDVTMAHDLAGIATGEDAKVTWAMRPVMKAASFMFHHAEKFNRQVTFIAAYRLARAAGADHLKGYTQAVDATYQGHFDYGSANRPRFMAGNVTKVLLLFKQYAQNMIYLLARQAHQSLKGLTPQDRTEARKALAGVLVTHAAVAGFLGLPLVGTLLSVASWLGSDDDEPWDAEAALRNSLADTFGTQAADIMAKGLSRATPWDISGRVGLNTLIMPDMQEGLEGKDLWKATLEAAAGPVAAIAGGIYEGLKLFGEGEYQRGAEAMLPAALRGPAKALRYGSEGAQDKTGVSIVDEVSAAGVAGQFLGLSPSEVRLATEAKSKVLSADKALMKRRSTLLNMAAKAAMAQDMEGLAEIREQIKAWNEKNPTRAINGQHIRASVAARRRRIANAENGVSLPQNRRGVIEAGAFGQQQAE